MWGPAVFGAVVVIAVLGVAFARPLEQALLAAYERQLATLEIPERTDEKIVTYPLA